MEIEDELLPKGFKPLPVTHIRDALADNLEYIKGRQEGTITSFRTKFLRLNKCLLDGFEDNTILTVGAMSGGGKSALSQLIRESIYDLNPDKPCVQVPMNFELLARSLAARSAVTKCNVSLKDMYSVEEPLTAIQLNHIQVYYRKISKREVYYVDRAGTPEQIVNSIYYYWLKFCKPTGKALLYEIDHMKLIKKAPGQTDLTALDDLCVRLVDMKKAIAIQKGSSFGVLLSQMNRDISKDNRVMNAEMHKPDASCLFGASSINYRVCMRTV